MKLYLRSVMFLLLLMPAFALSQTVSIQIKLIDGRTGAPVKNQQVGLEDRNGYQEISVHTNELGIAALNIAKDTEVLVHNTKEYVNCVDEAGGLIHNKFKVSEILSTGIVDLVRQPNLCGKASAIAKPGELILFVRPWRFGEKI